MRVSLACLLSLAYTHSLFCRPAIGQVLVDGLDVGSGCGLADVPFEVGVVFEEEPDARFVGVLLGDVAEFCDAAFPSYGASVQ